MYTLIDAFPKQLKEALEIGRKATLKAPGGPYGNVVVTGLGGSGIGGRIAAQLVHKEAKCPIEVYNNYYLPGYVNHKSLVIACSYSGNTEETLRRHGAGLEQGRSCGGDHQRWHHVGHRQGQGPGPHRHPRRQPATHHAGLFVGAAVLHPAPLRHHRRWFRRGHQDRGQHAGRRQGSIKKAAQELTDKLVGKRLVIYSEASTEAVSIRFRQQVNENSKELCWHHAIPEMNHNELVGWAGGKDDIAVVIFRHKEDHERSADPHGDQQGGLQEVHAAHPRRVEPRAIPPSHASCS
jgi:glucose/mannose-6-phosphate isomerase